jgi:hypothetical protein
MDTKIIVNLAKARYEHDKRLAALRQLEVDFKRTLRGTYVGCEVDHLGSYLDEQTFRFNNRYGNDAERFSLVLGSVAGKRLTYKQLIIKRTFKQLNFLKKLI